MSDNKDKKERIEINFTKEELEKAKAGYKQLFIDVAAFACSCIRLTAALLIFDIIGRCFNIWYLEAWQIFFFIWSPLAVMLVVVGFIVSASYAVVLFFALKGILSSIADSVQKLLR